MKIDKTHLQNLRKAKKYINMVLIKSMWCVLIHFSKEERRKDILKLKYHKSHWIMEEGNYTPPSKYQK